MSHEKPLSSVDATYNNLRDVQTSSYLDSSSYPKVFNMYTNKPINTNKPMIDTQTYLKQLENKYKPHKKEKKVKQKKYVDKSSSSSYDSVQNSDNDSNGYVKVTTKTANQDNEVPSKFKQINQTQNSFQQKSASQYGSSKYQVQQKSPIFNIPKNLTLSKGISERMNDSPPQYSQHDEEQPHWQVLNKMHEEYSQIKSQQGQNNYQVAALHSNYNQSIAQEQEYIPVFDQEDKSNKQKFFEVAVQLKNKLPTNHRGKQILVAKLYSQCIRDHIQESQWVQWIQTQLQSQ